jgi:hypothetical protein
MNTDMVLTTESPRARDLAPEQYALIQLVAGALHQSRYYQGISSESRAAYLMARAYELGFPATAAPDVIDDIQGRLTLKPQAAWALVLRSGLLASAEVTEGDDFCEVKLTRKDNGVTMGYRFTMEAAKKADLVKAGGAYEKWTKNMLYWRAMGFALDRAFPDVTMGLKDSAQFTAPSAAPAYRVDVVTGEVVEGEVV